MQQTDETVTKLYAEYAIYCFTTYRQPHPVERQVFVRL